MKNGAKQKLQNKSKKTNRAYEKNSIINSEFKCFRFGENLFLKSICWFFLLTTQRHMLLAILLMQCAKVKQYRLDSVLTTT